ncbi:MAG: hypothetical protein CXT73_07315, partial [Methanobacteriota archaeon]
MSAKEARKDFMFTRTSPNITLNINEDHIMNNSPTNSGGDRDTTPSILKNASHTSAKTESKDGFKKFNEIPVNPTVVPNATPAKSAEETLKEKFFYLRRLEAL